MRIKIFVHPDSKDSFWAKMSLKGISAEILRKRYTAEYVNAFRATDIDLEKEFDGMQKKVLLYIGISWHIYRVRNSTKKADFHTCGTWLATWLF